MKEIKLTKNKIAFIDDEDFEKVNCFKWCASKAGNTYYAVSRMMFNGKIKVTPMHRFLLNINDPNILVDHIDHNGCNNQRSNIRTSNKSQNAMNSTSRNKSSFFLGVSFDKVNNKWRAVIKKDYKQIAIGRFKTEIEAAKAYDKKAKEVFKEFANLNFK